MGSRACARSPGSSAPRVRISTFCPSRTKLCAGIFPDTTTPGATSSWAFTHCSGMKPASSSRPTWTKRSGRRMRKPYWKHVAGWIWPRPWSGLALVTGDTSGCFSSRRFRRRSRKLGAHLLTETMERRPGIGLDSYDRFFPNQDTLPQGGFGNLIALPLQKRPRELGNSVFLDEGHQPHTDQWAFLSRVRKIDRASVERIVSEAEKRGRVVGVRVAPVDEDAAAPWACTPLATPNGTPARRTAARKARAHSRRSDLHRQRSTTTPVCTIALSGWLHFRIRSSTRRRRCAYRPTASHALSPARRITRGTSVCRGVASTRSKSCCRICASTW